MKEVTHEEIKEILPSGFKLILDEKYKLPTDDEVIKSVNNFILHRHFLSELKNLLDKDLTPSKDNIDEIVNSHYKIQRSFEYTRNLHDCDNASWELVAWVSGKGWPIGIAIIPGHSLAVFINDKKEVKYIDQYTGELIENKERLKVTVMP